MEVLQKKLDRQLIGVNKWVHSAEHGAPSNGCGTFWWYTAVGKTFAALIIANRMFDKRPSARTVVIVPSSDNARQWKEEISKHINVEYFQNIEVYTIHYLVEHQYNLTCDLLIADEIHEYLTPERLVYLDKTKIKYNFILGLTATWEDSQKRQKALTHICPVIDRISEQEALKEGFISQYVEYNLSVDLTEAEMVSYKHHSELISKYLPKFNNVLDLAQKCLGGGVHTDGNTYSGFKFAIGWAMRNGWYPNGDLADEEYYKVNDLWNPQKVIGYAKSLMNSIRERKDILYNAVNKAYRAAEIVKKYPNLKTICFAQSTAFADKLGLIINQANPNSCVVYHSNLETIHYVDEKGKPRKKGKVILKREAIERIRNGQATVISTASALDRGFNVEDIRMGITTSGTQNPTQHSQRGGRVKRLELYAPDCVVLLINLYIPDTVDEKWLRKRQSKSHNTIYWIASIDDINYIPSDPTIINANLF